MKKTDLELLNKIFNDYENLFTTDGLLNQNDFIFSGSYDDYMDYSDYGDYSDYNDYA